MKVGYANLWAPETAWLTHPYDTQQAVTVCDWFVASGSWVAARLPTEHMGRVCMSISACAGSRMRTCAPADTVYDVATPCQGSRFPAHVRCVAPTI